MPHAAQASPARKRHSRPRRGGRLAGLACLVCFALSPPASAQQRPDPDFDTTVVRPAFLERHPRVVVDEAHHEFHTAGGRYRAFAGLLRSDGCDVRPGLVPFTPESLRGTDVLVIANALGHDDMSHPDASRPAFTAAECHAVLDRVREGGALLLIADHAPMGAAARCLGDSLGVDMRSGYTMDPGRARGAALGILTFTAGAGLDESHPIVMGRDSSERVRTVVTFTGQSLAGPANATVLLALSDRAEDQMVGLGEAGPRVPASKRRPAAGRAQGLAFMLGRGRVVVLGEAAMMSAQVAGPLRAKMGMNRPGSDDRQFALNIVRWLAGAPGPHD